jgi:prophage regulatory protein
MQRLLRLPRVLEITGLRKTQILDAVKDGRFPRPTTILAGGRAHGWPESEIAEYVQSRIAARDQTTPNPKPRRGKAA